MKEQELKNQQLKEEEILRYRNIKEDKLREVEGYFYHILNRKMQILENQREQKNLPELTQFEYIKERGKILEELKKQVAAFRMNWYKVAKLLG